MQQAMPSERTSGDSVEPRPDTEHRQIVYRVLFDRPAIAQRLGAVAGAWALRGRWPVEQDAVRDLAMGRVRLGLVRAAGTSFRQ